MKLATVLARMPTRMLAGTLVGLLLGLATALGATPAAASPRIPPVVVVPANAAGDCLSRGQVWLVVVTDTGATLANRCVGRPANGMAALQAAGLATTFAPGGYICTMGGYPSKCPTTYDGRFWHYYHSTTGTRWAFADTGPAGYRYPASGMIDGWCYNAAGTTGCTPPTISVVKPNTQAPTTQPASTASKPTASSTRTTAAPTTSAPSTTTPANPTRSNGQPTRVPARTGSSGHSPAASSTVGSGSGSPGASASSNTPSSTPAVTGSGSTGSPSAGSSSAQPSSPAGTPTTSTDQPGVTASTPASGGPWGVIGTGAALLTGGLAWVGWRRIRQP